MAAAVARATCLLVLPDRVLERLRELTTADSVGGVRFIVADAYSVHDEPCDVLLHKAAFDVACAAADDPLGTARCEALRRRASSGSTLFFDPLPSVERFADRSAICHALSSLAPAVRQPRFAVLRDGSDASIAEVLERLRLPFVCKPLVACGTDASHQLAVVLRAEGLRELCSGGGGASPCPPMLVQEHVSHGGTCLKAYLVGDETHVASRRSLPDLSAAAAGADGPAVVPFNSQQPGPGPEAFGAHADRCADADADAGADAAAPLDRRREAAEAVCAVGAHMGVQLLGVDLVVESSTGDMLVVDANYFPQSPATFPRLAEALARAVGRAAAERGGRAGAGGADIRGGPCSP